MGKSRKIKTFKEKFSVITFYVKRATLAVIFFQTARFLINLGLIYFSPGSAELIRPYLVLHLLQSFFLV
jgi:hypothetical protein